MRVSDNFRARAANWFELQGGAGRLLPMEGMRGLSALLVFFVHFHALFGSRIEQSPVHGLSAFLATLGHCGVDVFFALSGFIIYGLLLRKPFGYVSFVRRRMARLYPTFTAIFLLYVGLSIAFPSVSKLPQSLGAAGVYLMANYLMLPGIFPIVPMITPAWSLSYELCFYLTLPLVVRWLRIYAWPHPRRAIFWLCVCCGYLALFEAGVGQHPRMIMFGCGVLLRETIHQRIGWERFGNIAALVGFALALTWFGLQDSQIVTSICGPIVTRSALTYGSLFISTYSLGYYALSGNGFLAKCFSWDWLRWFGNISYSFYLTHGLALHFLKGGLEFLHLPAQLSPLSYLALCCATLIGTIVGSAAVFLLVEKRFLLSMHSSGAPKLVPADAELARS